MRRDILMLFGLALLVGIGGMTIIDEPGYTDAYYYYNAAHRLADGEGLTDPYLWNYLRLPDELPAPSHTYWMPLTSLLVAGSMMLFGVTFTAAQLPSILALAGLTTLAGWLGNYLGGSRRYLWMTGLLVLFGGLFFPFWFTTDAFALYGLLGCGTLITMSIDRDWRWFALTGVLSGLAHLTRADGVLLLLVAMMLIWWPYRAEHPEKRGQLTGGLLVGYLMVMVPWFIRNVVVLDAPLPAGGINTAFLRDYNELFAYPVDWSAANFWDWGLGNILQSRWESFSTNLASWVAVETFVLMGPFALWALWKRRHNRFLMGFNLYALGLHLAMTFVFAYPGYRGGLFHSSAALLPFWAVLGVLGLDDLLEKMETWRGWQRDRPRLVFGVAVVIITAFVGIGALSKQLESIDDGLDYQDLATHLPDDAVLMVNDPAAWYYHTSLWGINLPDTPLERLPELVERYCLTHLILDENVTTSFEPLILDKEPPPDFLELTDAFGFDTESTDDDVQIYRFTLTCQTTD